jgi:hypothetical protein
MDSNLSDSLLKDFHQSPEELCKDIISNIPFENDDIILEPFAGINNFYNNFPQELTKYRCEITDDGGCFKDFDYNGKKPSIIVTNPPFKINNRNAFFDIILYFSKIESIKRMVILCSSICYDSLTPKRMMKINEQNMFITKLDTCCVKKWRGRYKIIYFEREYSDKFNYYLQNY